MSVRARWLLGVSVLTLSLTIATAITVATPSSASPRPQPVVTTTKARCPWMSTWQLTHRSPDQLAREVLGAMSLQEKAQFVVLNTHAPLGNTNVGVPRLCLPALTMSDGPVGLANGLPGVTQWPAAIALAATFDSSLAARFGRALGAETHAKGLDAIQAPELNIARVPLSGRVFETFGEDPFLAGSLGAAEIRGIQSQAVMAVLKHFGAYTQETARLFLRQRVGGRALDELYLAAFRQAVQQGHPAAIMCAYGFINGVNTCADAALVRELRQWGFDGIIRSDLHAVFNVPASLRAGIDLLKPTSAQGLARLVRRGRVSLPTLDHAVRDVLTEMFRFHLVAQPRTFTPYRPVTSAADVALARQMAQESIVLLKNTHHLLPLTSSAGPFAVMGLDAQFNPIVAGGGSSAVLPASLETPLAALRALFGTSHVHYERGSTNASNLNVLSDLSYQRGKPFLNGEVVPTTSEPGVADLDIESSPFVTPQVATATAPLSGPGWNHETVPLETQRGGTYEIAVQQYGDTWVTLNGQPLLSSPGIHARNIISTSLRLRGRHRYDIAVNWFAIRSHQPPRLGILNVSARLAAAVDAARHARTAIIFASSYTGEGADLPSLLLPGDQNALITAVARVNPRTIVVLNTGGAVAMPWLHRVAAVLEAWYPGQSDGPAIAAVLSGAVNPSGRLPLTFPQSLARSATATPAAYPGINGVVQFGASLDVGYRWYQRHGVAPLFPFGFGLSYTTFATSRLEVVSQPSRLVGHVTVTNTGSRAGIDVVEVYLHYPPSTGEPPEQLKAFVRVAVAPHASRQVAFVIPRALLTIYPGGVAQVVPGVYRLDVGSSSNDLTTHANVPIA